jgi:hypothetical protein
MVAGMNGAAILEIPRNPINHLTLSLSPVSPQLDLRLFAPRLLIAVAWRALQPAFRIQALPIFAAPHPELAQY